MSTILVHWQTGTPDVPAGSKELFWCRCDNGNGVALYYPLVYANRYQMPLSDSCYDPPKGCEPVPDSDDDYYWTGWFEKSCQQCETQWASSYKVMEWMRLPRSEGIKP